MATKKSAPKKASTIAVSGTIPKIKLNMPLDARKIKAIQKCIEKGNLSITLTKVDLGGGRLGDGWLYD